MPQAIPVIVGALKAAIAKITLSAVITFAVKTAIVFGVSKLLAKRSLGGFGQEDAGARVQLPPASQNVLPVVYGKAYIKPTIVDAKISTDQKFMWYVCALAEHTDSTAGSGYTFGDIYWNGARCNFSGASVTSTTNNAQQTDNKMNGKIFIYRYPNGSASGITSGGANAITVMSDFRIPANLRWNSAKYTTGGQSAAMTNTCFLIVRLEYNTDADILGLGELTVELINSINKPGDAIKDYLLNERYGCAVPLDNIDTDSFDDLNTYSDETITYTDTDSSPATQSRYRINGPINTAQPCLRNLQDLADACDSWLQYSDLEDKWKVVINKPYDAAPNAVTTGDLYHVISDYGDNSNLIGGIQINPIDLNASFNSVQIAYPDSRVRDQTNVEIFDFIDPTSDWYDPALLSPNEPNNRLDFELPQVNNYIQAAYLGVRRLLQSREDLVVAFQLDYSGIQIEAGDVIKITSNEYGWAEKLFRVSQVQEIKDEAGNLYAKIQAFEYNSTIYGDNALIDYVPADNTGIDNPDIIETVETPVVIADTDDTVATVVVTGEVPDTGLVTGIDFNWGFDPNSFNHLYFNSIWNANGAPLPSTALPSTVEIGKQYRINTLGGTDWAGIGAIEIDLGLQPNLDSFLRVGDRVIIAETGNTDFTVQGAPNNDVGTSFIATNTEFARGTGRLFKTDFYATSVASPLVLFSGNGEGDLKVLYSAEFPAVDEGDYYFSITARTDAGAVISDSTAASVYFKPGVTETQEEVRCTANSSGNTITFGTANDSLKLGANVTFDTSNALYTPTGVLGANTYITKIVSNTEIQVTPTPTTPLSNDCVAFSYLNPRTGQPAGGINASSIYTDTITSLGTLDSLTVSGNVNFYGPNVTLGDVANMHIAGGNNGYFLQTNGNGVISWANGTTTGNGTVGGANRQIQYNNDGNFAGSVGFEFDSDTSNMVVPNWINSGLANNNGYLVGLEYNDVMTDAIPVTSMFIGNTNGFANLVIGNSYTLTNNAIAGSSSNFVIDVSSNLFGNASEPYHGQGRWGPAGSNLRTVIYSTGGNANLIANVYSNTLYETGNIGNAGARMCTPYYIQSSPLPANYTWNTGFASTDSSNSDIYLTRGTFGNSNSWTTNSLSIGANYYPIQISDLTNAGPGGPFPVQVVSSNSSTNAFTVNTTIDVANGLFGPGDTSLLTVDQKIETFNTPIGNTTSSTTYYIKSIVSNTEVTISETLGGNTFQPTDDTGLDVWSDNNDPVGYSIIYVSSETETPTNKYYYADASGNVVYSGTFTGKDANTTANANSITFAPYIFNIPTIIVNNVAQSTTRELIRRFPSSRRKNQLGRLGTFVARNPKFHIYSEIIYPTVTPNATSSYAYDSFSPLFSNVFPGYGPNNQPLRWMACRDEDIANGISNTYMAFFEYPVGGGTPTITTTIGGNIPTAFAPILTGNSASGVGPPMYSYTGQFIGIQNQGDASTGDDTKLVFSEDGNNWIEIANNLPNNYATFVNAVQTSPFDDFTGNIVIDINGMTSVDPLSSPYVISSNANFELISASSVNSKVIFGRIYAGYQHSNGTNSTSISEGTYKSLGVISPDTYMFIRIA
jgi:hypothetical protein